MPLKKAKMLVRNQVELCAKSDLIALQSFGQECPRSILNKFPLTVFIFQRPFSLFCGQPCSTLIKSYEQKLTFQSVLRIFTSRAILRPLTNDKFIVSRSTLKLKTQSDILFSSNDSALDCKTQTDLPTRQHFCGRLNFFFSKLVFFNVEIISTSFFFETNRGKIYDTDNRITKTDY
jgi:hypothetical protein